MVIAIKFKNFRLIVLVFAGLLLQSFAIDKCLAQSINSAVVGAVRGIYRAELNGIVTRDRNNIRAAQKASRITPNYSQQRAYNSSKLQPAQSASRIPVWPASSRPVQSKSRQTISEKELNSRGFESF